MTPESWAQSSGLCPSGWREGDWSRPPSLSGALLCSPCLPPSRQPGKQALCDLQTPAGPRPRPLLAACLPSAPPACPHNSPEASKPHAGLALLNPPGLPPPQVALPCPSPACGGHLLTSPVWPPCGYHWALGSALAAVGVSELGHLHLLFSSACSCLPPPRLQSRTHPQAQLRHPPSSPRPPLGP